ncbi:MAG TPA: LPS assembly protein LptD [Gammaproteobacteria bacterium]|nr:LPS assembly protein LptD [Gammaproteobacteria bacterium]
MKEQKAEVSRQKPESVLHTLAPGFCLLASSLLTFTALTGPALAQNGGGSEPGQWRFCPDPRLVTESSIHGADASGRIFADADRIETLNANASRLSGNVAILRGVEELFADEALYDRAQQRFELTGNVRYRSPQMELTGESLLSYGEAATVKIENAEFYFPAQHAAGSADKIERDGVVTTLIDTHYSTCDRAEPDWEFRARRITLDQAKGQGFSRDMKLYFKDVPIFYFPVLSFPIDDRRKSGFLLPRIGDSDKHGFELETPYYWNIAPQADATLTPHQMTRRGVKLDTEWRYLNRWSMNELKLEYLDDDRFGGARDLEFFQHGGSFGDGWYSTVDYNAVSDNDYLDDFGSNLSGSSLTHLRQEARLRKVWDYWEFRGRVLEFQTIDETLAPENRPYRLNPALELQGDQPLGDHVKFSLAAGATDFEHDLLVAGQRFDIRPRLALSYGGSGWHLIPALSARHTAYHLEDPAVPGNDREIDRDVPTFSLDSGLVFERSLGTEGRLRQTLEPRLFLLKTPFREQDDIPVFDTRLPDFSFAQLFSENRFVGADRVGDAEQASIALTSSLLRRDNGEELLRAGIGRIYYNQDRRVTLPGQAPERQEKSGLLAEIGTDFSRRWSGSVTVEWNSERGETDKELVSLRYRRDNRHIFNLAYRSRAAEDLEQSDMSFSWPVSDRWSAVGRWNHSLNDDIDLERFAGLQYESCCYAIRIVAREYLTETQAQNSAVFFQLSLKGLGGIGDNMDELLERSITGYRNPY